MPGARWLCLPTLAIDGEPFNWFGWTDPLRLTAAAAATSGTVRAERCGRNEAGQIEDGPRGRRVEAGDRGRAPDRPR
jgi:hypothetical protein